MSTTTIVYRTAPQAEKKAARELRENGIRAYVPSDHSTGRRSPTARGYVFAQSAYVNAYAKHVKSRVGIVAKDELVRLYLERQRKQEPSRKFKDGDRVIITKGLAEIKATIVGHRERMYFVAFDLLGKTQRQAIHEMHIRPGLST